MHHRAAIEGTGEPAKAFVYWQTRCELVELRIGVRCDPLVRRNQ